MSVEIVFYPNSSDKNMLCAHLREFGFLPCTHLWNWPKSSKNFQWFEDTDFVSFDGVEATVYPTRAGEKEDYPQSLWAIHTRTRSSASQGDRKQQNEVIRTARRKFGGSFVNDCYGKNRYTTIEPDPRDAAARGIYLSYEYVRNKISSVKYALPDPNESLEKLVGTNLEAISTIDPARVIYNALVPFAIACLEHFFSSSFKILLRYDQKAQAKLLDDSRKVEIADVVAVRDGSKSLEDIVVNWYSFQSIASINKAYHDWLGIDIWSLLRKRRRLGSRLPRLESDLNDLIEFRHGVVHRLELDLQIRKHKAEELFDLVMLIIDEVTGHLEASRGIPIRDSTIYS